MPSLRPNSVDNERMTTNGYGIAIGKRMPLHGPPISVRP